MWYLPAINKPDFLLLEFCEQFCYHRHKTLIFAITVTFFCYNTQAFQYIFLRHWGFISLWILSTMILKGKLGVHWPFLTSLLTKLLFCKMYHELPTCISLTWLHFYCTRNIKGFRKQKSSLLQTPTMRALVEKLSNQCYVQQSSI